MTASILFTFPAGWQIGLPLSLILTGWIIFRLHPHGLSRLRIATLALLRGLLFVLLSLLIARPVQIEREPPSPSTPRVAILLDRSESMSVEEAGTSRYQKIVTFVRDGFIPALRRAGLEPSLFLFDEQTELATGAQVGTATPKGRRTNLGRAISQATTQSSAPPLAIFALTDGVTNEKGDNNKALSALMEERIPLFALGVGEDRGLKTLSVREVEGPATASKNTEFRITAHMEAINLDDSLNVDLLLLRNGQFCQKKTIETGKASRLWLESFTIKETTDGVYEYTIQLLPPATPEIRCLAREAHTSVRISDEKELRILYVQEALTWDYKFITLALHGDPTMKITGLTRTSTQSVFRQNVESSGELVGGFPTTLREISPFRVVVLSNIRPTDLTPAQQELLKKFSSDLGGGVLMIGGAETFDSSWQGSPLEQLLPVIFDSGPGVQGLDRPFHLQLTEDALSQAFFQLNEDPSPRTAWNQLPTFTGYGRVDSAKAGAQIWMQHPEDKGAKGSRILMAGQHYGAGRSVILCVQNFWRWRLAHDSNTSHFDRFWRQLFRYLGEAGRQEILIHVVDQELHPDMDVHLVLERPPDPKEFEMKTGTYTVRVETEAHERVEEKTIELSPKHPADMNFPAKNPGIYSVQVYDPQQVMLSSRTIEIRDISVELQNTARNMEQLIQWASLSSGQAYKAEESPSPDEIVSHIKKTVSDLRRKKIHQHPVGIHWTSFLFLFACLAGEWTLRKKWNLM